MAPRRVWPFALIVAIIAASAASVSTAAIAPKDQALAEQLSLRRNDLGSGWKTVRPRSSRFRSVGCTTAPKIERSITGYFESPRFSDLADDELVYSVTRVFPSEKLAKQWFEWARSSKSTQCRHEVVSEGWRQEGYEVTRSTSVGQSFVLICGSCIRHTLQAWSLSRTLVKGNAHLRRGRCIGDHADLLRRDPFPVLGVRPPTVPS